VCLCVCLYLCLCLCVCVLVSLSVFVCVYVFVFYSRIFSKNRARLLQKETAVIETCFKSVLQLDVTVFAPGLKPKFRSVTQDL
jgi:hypothetical protein